ncbi:MAG: hypothetical protein PF588_06795 [Candidatus Kapabacteria bacterium]|nr:hypothetical protein [Candidatus Kapabacteria bacterium]
MTKTKIMIIILMTFIAGAGTSFSKGVSQKEKYQTAVDYIMKLDRTSKFCNKLFGHRTLNYCMADSTSFAHISDFYAFYYKGTAEDITQMQKDSTQEELFKYDMAKIQAFKRVPLPELSGENCDVDHFQVQIHEREDSIFVVKLYPVAKEKIELFKQKPLELFKRTSYLKVFMYIDALGEVKYTQLIKGSH